MLAAELASRAQASLRDTCLSLNWFERLSLSTDATITLKSCFSCPDRLRHLFLAGERCDVETLEWAKASFGVPVLDHWWQTGEISPFFEDELAPLMF